MKGERLVDVARLNGEYPFLATPKWDGIRAFTFEPIQQELVGAPINLVSLTLTEIPNQHVQETIRATKHYEFMYGLDGELVTYTDGKMDSYNTVQSKIMSQHGKPDFKYHVFDHICEDNAFQRSLWLAAMVEEFPQFISLSLPTVIDSREMLESYEEKQLKAGFEGVMLRKIEGEYKFGRSTIRQGHLIKLKRFQDAEATVIGFTELEHNENEATLDTRGLTERSDHKSGKVAGGTLGALICNGHNGVQFNIGTGFTAEQRQNIWNQRENFKFAVVKYKYQPHGVKTKPRSPVFLGFRHPGDIE